MISADELKMYLLELFWCEIYALFCQGFIYRVNQEKKNVHLQAFAESPSYLLFFVTLQMRLLVLVEINKLTVITVKPSKHVRTFIRSPALNLSLCHNHLATHCIPVFVSLYFP